MGSVGLLWGEIAEDIALYFVESIVKLLSGGQQDASKASSSSREKRCTLSQKRQVSSALPCSSIMARSSSRPRLMRARSIRSRLQSQRYAMD